MPWVLTLINWIEEFESYFSALKHSQPCNLVPTDLVFLYRKQAMYLGNYLSVSHGAISIFFKFRMVFDCLCRLKETKITHGKTKRYIGNWLHVSYGAKFLFLDSWSYVDCLCRPWGTSALKSVWPSQDQAWAEARAAAYHVVLTATLRPPVLWAEPCSASAKSTLWFQWSLLRVMYPWEFWLVRIQ